MSFHLNKVTLIGNLGQDPEIRAMQNGGKVANISIATSEGWKDKATGEWKNKTEWHRVTVFSEFALKRVEKLKKGAKVFVEGKLVTRKWQDQSGATRTSTEINVSPFGGHQVIPLDPPRQDEGGDWGSAGGNGDPAGDPGGARGAFRAAAAATGGQSGFDDEIPF